MPGGCGAPHDLLRNAGASRGRVYGAKVKAFLDTHASLRG